MGQIKQVLKMIFFPLLKLNEYLANVFPNRLVHGLVSILVVYPLIIQSLAFVLPKIMPESIVMIIILIVFIFGWSSPFLVKNKYREKKTKKKGILGDARFSLLSELKNAGLVGAGVVFGYKDKVLIEKPTDKEGNGLIVGAPGTGKSAGVAIPTLLRWQGAALVVDIKGELSEKTSHTKNKVFIFDPEHGGDAYDPLRECKTVDGAQELARYLCPIPEQGEPFWAQSAQGILAACAYEAAVNGDRTFGEVLERICLTPIMELVSELQTSPLKPVRLLSAVGSELNDKAITGVAGELRSKLLTLASDERVHRATSRNNWSANSLEEGATVYIRVSEYMLQQYRDLWSLILSQIMRHLSKREEKQLPHILLLLDELPRLGEIQILPDALATLRSRNVVILGLIQSIAQLDMIYGEGRRKVIADLCAYKLVLSASDPDTQKYFSSLAGQKTVMAKGYSTNGVGILPGSSANEQGTELIRPEEWARLEKPVLFAPQLHPTQLDTLAFWFKTPSFKKVIEERPKIQTKKNYYEQYPTVKEESAVTLESTEDSSLDNI